MRPYLLVAALLLIVPVAAIIAEADDSEARAYYTVYFHIQGGGSQAVTYTTQAHPPDVEGVLFWTMTEPDTHEGITVVHASDVWNQHRHYGHDLDLYPVMGAFILVDDAGVGPMDWRTIGIASALGAVLGAILVLIVGVWRGYIAPFKSRQA